jgi:hypothetical protein
MAVSIFHVRRNFTAASELNQPGDVDSLFSNSYHLFMKLMKQRHLTQALIICCAAAGAFLLGGCETAENRIAEHQDIYNSLSPNDQALVSQGKIRYNMPMNAVWLAWGSPAQKSEGNMRGHPTETWVYVQSRSATPYGYGYPYYGYGYGGYGFGGGVGVIAARHHHGGRSFLFYGDPYYDPFFYSYIPPTISYPYKTVTFQSGRVMSFQYLVNPY